MNLTDLIENTDPVDASQAAYYGLPIPSQPDDADNSTKTHTGRNGGTKRKSTGAGGFIVADRGVYYKDDAEKQVWICSRLDITALVRDGDSTSWGRLLEFVDRDGIRHAWTMPMQLLAGGGDSLRSELLSQGLIIAPGLSARNKLAEYIATAKVEARARCVNKTGWHGNVFVFPDRTIGESSERVLYQSDSVVKNYRQAGTLAEWQQHVSKPCAGNSRLVLAISTSFASMLLNHAGVESGGLHFVGESSCGKTTAQKAACSVFGGADYLNSWRATSNGLEGRASEHNDTLLVLDELAQVDAKEAGEIAYMLANGSGKARAGRAGNARASAKWRLLFLSSGEIGLAQHMSEGGKKVKAGQEIRLVELTADAGAGYGIFETLNGAESGADLSKAITSAADRYHGTAAIAFIESLVTNLDGLVGWLRAQMTAFTEKVLPAGAQGQAHRVCERFALIGIAGEYATANGITGWQKGDAVKAAATCFKSWLNDRGGSGNQEKASILASVKSFFEQHGESRFTDMDKDSNHNTINRAGFRQTVNCETKYIVLTESFKREICAGYDQKSVSKLLIEAGWLDTGADGKSSKSLALRGIGKTRCYVFNSKMWEA